MRFIYKIETGGSSKFYRSSDDGKEVIQKFKDWDDAESKPQRVRRLIVFIEVGCDDTPTAKERASKALVELQEQLSRV